MRCGSSIVIENGMMSIIVRESDSPYKWSIGSTEIVNIANKEKMLPDEYITDDGYNITDAFRTYCEPLIEGEAYPPFTGGLPDYVRLKKELVPPRTG